MVISLQAFEDDELEDIAAFNIELQLDEGSTPMSHEAAVARLKKWLAAEYQPRREEILAVFRLPRVQYQI